MVLKNPVTPSGTDPGTVRLVTQRLNHYATLGPAFNKKLMINQEIEHPVVCCAGFTFSEQPLPPSAGSTLFVLETKATSWSETSAHMYR